MKTTQRSGIVLVILLGLACLPAAAQDPTMFVTGGNVAVGTNTPSDSDSLAEHFLEVVGTTGASRLIVDSGSGQWSEFLMQEGNVNKWSFGYAGSGLDSRFYIWNYPRSVEDISINFTTGRVTIFNGLSVIGGCTGCDAVLQPDWPLESIDEHAAAMYENSYLPAVGPTPEGEIAIDVFEKTTGMLQELEKAHIYIAQLHERLERLETLLAEERQGE